MLPFSFKGFFKGPVREKAHRIQPLKKPVRGAAYKKVVIFYVVCAARYAHRLYLFTDNLGFLCAACIPCCAYCWRLLLLLFLLSKNNNKHACPFAPLLLRSIRSLWYQEYQKHLARKTKGFERKREVCEALLRLGNQSILTFLGILKLCRALASFLILRKRDTKLRKNKKTREGCLLKSFILTNPCKRNAHRIR